MARRLALPKNECDQVEGAIRTAYVVLGTKTQVNAILDWMNRERRTQLHWLLEAVNGDSVRLRKFISRRRPGWKADLEVRGAERGVGYFTQQLVKNYGAKDSEAGARNLVGLGLAGLSLIVGVAAAVGQPCVAGPTQSPVNQEDAPKRELATAPRSLVAPPGPVPAAQRTPTRSREGGGRPQEAPPAESAVRARRRREPRGA